MGGGRSNKRDRPVAGGTSTPARGEAEQIELIDGPLFAPSHLARPRTRGTNPKLTDPIANTNNLNACLKAQGLYAANTVGDGNCLFRALSDQLWGSQSNHALLRQWIVDFERKHKDEYAGFIEDERGIDVHLDNMEKPGTYGGHVELSVFSRMMRLNVKVIQPDVSFMIEHKNVSSHDDDSEPSSSTGSPRRRKQYQTAFPQTEGTIYVAYHDWEHFSSVRNLKGPHQGLPKVQEAPVEEQENTRPGRAAKQPTISKHKMKAMRGKVPVNHLLKQSTTTKSAASTSTSKASSAPTKSSDVPTPDSGSRGSSPLTSLSQEDTSSIDASATRSGSGSGSSAPSSLAPVTPPDGQFTSSGRSGLDSRLRSRLGVERAEHSSRSPKRSFGDSDLEVDGERDGSVDGRRVRRKPVSNTSNLSSASPASNMQPPTSSPEDMADSDGEGPGANTLDNSNEDDDEDDGDMSVLKLLAGSMADGYSTDSSLSPPPPDPSELETATLKARLRKKPGAAVVDSSLSSQFLEPSSQTSIATYPPSSVSPSSRPSPAPFEGLSQESMVSITTTTTNNDGDDEESQGTATSPATGPKAVANAPRLTRRQRKVLGLPKHGNGSGEVEEGERSGRSNVIVIPGGRHPSRLAIKAAQERERLDAYEKEDDDPEFQPEWERNGSGRKDSRGFVILNI